MYKKIIVGLLGLAAFATVGAGTTNAHAASTVQIAGQTARKHYLHIATYYRTTRATKVTINYEKTHSTKLKSYSKSMTLPKGTIVDGDAHSFGTATTGSLYPEVHFNSNRLSYNLLNKGVKKGYQANEIGTSIATGSFKQISTPAYMPTWSYGDLYLGGASATKQPDESSQNVQITDNGYVEVHKKNASAQFYNRYFNKPVASAKIKKTTNKGSTRYLYLSKSLKGFKTTRVGHKGAYEYRLSMKNLHEPQVNPSNNEDADYSSFYSLYSLGGKTYYTPLGTSGPTTD